MQFGRHIFSKAYTNNVKSLYTRASGHINDCIEFLWGLYIGIIVPYVHMN